jgi:hypothetical protein
VREKKMAEVGDRIAIVAGLSMHTPGTMNNLIIQTVGDDWTDGVRAFPRLAD